LFFFGIHDLNFGHKQIASKKHAKKELSQYAAIIACGLVNQLYISTT